MKFHLFQTGAVGRRHEIEEGMAGQRKDLFQRYIAEAKEYVALADELGFYGYGHNEHHLQMEGFEESNHPGMMSLFLGQNSEKITIGTLGYVLPTHNPLRAAEEIATLDHMLKGRLLVGFVRGYQSRWVDSFAAVPGIHATTPDLARDDERDVMNRAIFQEDLQIVKLAWNNPTFSFKGQFWEFPPGGSSDGHSAYEKFGPGLGPDGRVHEVGIAPRCYQDPHPRIYGAFAHSMRTIQMWAREGGKPIVMANQLDFCETLWQKYAETAEEAGRDVAPDDIAAWGGILLLGRDKAHAKELHDAYMWFVDSWITPFNQGVPNLICGTSDEVTEQIEDAWERLHFNEMWMNFGQGLRDEDEVKESLHQFATEIMPRFSDKNELGIYV
jgi:alkanesulfonate monooxygenase SsuD/methylene tetrahydromethanopterin reductase-like flavin-dependent oxidoreductase (luciferase family)